MEPEAIGASVKPYVGMDYWRQACEQLQREHAESWGLLQPFCPTEEKPFSEIAEQGRQHILEAQKLRATNHPRSQKVRKWLENSLKLIDRFSKGIAAVAAVNPYASLACTVVSAVIPVALLPKTENDEAMQGIQDILELIHKYRTLEASIHPSKLRPEAEILPTKMKDLYIQILLYEAALLKHKNAKAVSRLVEDIKGQGQWKKRNEELKRLDREFTTIWDSELRVREDSMRDQESEWHQELRQNLKDEEKADIFALFDTDYETIKRSKESKGKRVKGTCGWFLNHRQFSSWKSDEKSSILWVSAGPGCGKSVLSLFIFDEREKRLKTKDSDQPLFCYYFFSNEFPTQNNPATCLKALIHQLLVQQPYLCRTVKEQLLGRNRQQAATEFHTLWKIFLTLASVSDSQHGIRPVICVIDALDECQIEPETGKKQFGSREEFIRELVQFYLGRAAQALTTQLKIIITSRPYESIEGSFVPLVRRLENLWLRGEDESPQMQREISKVVRVRVKELAKRKELTPKSSDRLISALNRTRNRTYLWLHLTLDYIEKELYHQTSDIEDLLVNLPPSVETAYEKILDGSTNQSRARKLLSIVLAATRPLSPIEAWFALEASGKLKRRFSGLNVSQEDKVGRLITNLCGLILQVVDGKITFIHQTARDYLINQDADKEPEGLRSKFGWKKSFFHKDYHAETARSCVQMIYTAYLLARKERHPQELESPTRSDVSEIDEGTDSDDVESDSPGSLVSDEYEAYNHSIASQKTEVEPESAPEPSLQPSQFLDYASKNYLYHIREASTALQEDVLELLYDNDNAESSSWLKFLSRAHLALLKPLPDDFWTTNLTPLRWAAEVDVDQLFRFAKSKGVDFSKYHEKGVYPLATAAYAGSEHVIRFLLSANAPVNALSSVWVSRDSNTLKDSSYVYAFKDMVLGWGMNACRNLSVMEKLLHAGADPNLLNNKGFTPLQQYILVNAKFQDDFEMADNFLSLLLRYGADLDKLSGDGSTALDILSQDRDDSWSLLAEHLVNAGANIKGRGITALQAAAANGWSNVVQAILRRDDCNTEYLSIGVKEGLSALDHAITADDVKSVTALLRCSHINKSNCIESLSSLSWMDTGILLDSEIIKIVLMDREMFQGLYASDGSSLLEQMLRINSPMAIFLLEEAIRLDQFRTVISFNAFSAAIEGGDASVLWLLHYLIWDDFDVNCTPDGRDSLLITACEDPDPQIIKTLVVWGAEPVIRRAGSYVTLFEEVRWSRLFNFISEVRKFFSCLQIIVAAGFGSPIFKAINANYLWARACQPCSSKSKWVWDESLWYWRLRTLTLLYQWMVECDARPNSVYLNDVIGCAHEMRSFAYFPCAEDEKQYKIRSSVARQYWEQLASEGVWVSSGSRPPTPLLGYLFADVADTAHYEIKDE